MYINVSKIAYIHVKQLDELKETLNELDFDFVEKVESEMNPEVWVVYSDMLVENLVRARVLSTQDESELHKNNQAIGIDEILFYG